MERAFSDLRVIDTTHVLAGPFASYQLAMLGAEVIKVESPHDPDQARFQGSDCDMVTRAMGTSFMAQGGGKRTLALDLKTQDGRAALIRLIERADVFVENYRPGAFEALGLGPVEMLAHNPRLIYCSVSAFGAIGPRCEQTGYDNVIQAFSGIMDMTGHGDGRALKCGAPVIDYATGLTAAFAISAALFQRERNGGLGQHIDVSMLDVAMTLLTSHATDFLWSGKAPRPKGNEFAFASLGMYRASDGDLMIGASNLRQHRRLWIALGREEMVRTSNIDRIENYAPERAALQEIIGAMPVAFWENFLTERRIPVSRIRTLAEALSDPQVNERHQFIELADPAGSGRPIKVATTGFRMSRSAIGVDLPPQPVGAHTAEILRELGFEDAQIEAFCLAGIVQQSAETSFPEEFR